jgi:hypothetical protein
LRHDLPKPLLSDELPERFTDLDLNFRGRH